MQWNNLQNHATQTKYGATTHKIRVFKPNTVQQPTKSGYSNQIQCNNPQNQAIQIKYSATTHKISLLEPNTVQQPTKSGYSNQMQWNNPQNRATQTKYSRHHPLSNTTHALKPHFWTPQKFHTSAALFRN